MSKRIFALIAVAASCLAAKAQVVINEIMQSNVDCIMDDINEYPDSWVELYNAGNTSVNLSDYSIGDASNADKAWQLPQETLAPKAFRLVYCDKEAKKWHASFRLESGKGCTLYLFKDGKIADRLPSDMKKQPAPNIAYGRQTDGGDKWGYQLTPTPGAKNCGEVCSNKNILPDPVFSKAGRVMKKGERCTIQITMPEDAPEGTEIRYTEDGSEPTAESPLFSGSLRITATKVIRAKAFCKGYLSPRSVTQTYIFFDRDITLPVISIATDRKNLYDSKTGIYVEGNYNSGTKNYEYNWRRPINIEYFEEDLSASTLNLLCEARITGGASRGTALKSLGIYANKRFGEKRFDHEFFPDQKPGLKDFKSLMLRNAGNDFDYLYMRDAVIQRLMASNVSLDWQAWSPAIVYINGEYKGILNIRERSNENNIYTNYDGLEDITMVENLWELKEGNWKLWEDFMAFYNEHGHTWQEFDEIMDLQEYMDVMIMNFFFCNLDFPGNNIVFWRPNADGGRWRVVAKDTDFGLGLYGLSADYKIFEWLHNPDYDNDHHWNANGWEATRLFRRLMEDETFHREFIDRFAIYMGDFLNYDRTWEIWEPMYEKIKYEYPHHRELYNRWWPDYSKELSSAKQWLKDRVGKMYEQINNYYKAGTPKPLIINTMLRDEELRKISVTFNGAKLSRGKFNGKFFANRPFTLQGENVEAWEVTEMTAGKQNRQTIVGNTCTLTIPTTCSAMTIAARTTAPDGIIQIAQDNINAPKTPTEIYDISGTQRKTLHPGLNIVRHPDGTTRKIWLNQ